MVSSHSIGLFCNCCLNCLRRALFSSLCLKQHDSTYLPLIALSVLKVAATVAACRCVCGGGGGEGGVVPCRAAQQEAVFPIGQEDCRARGSLGEWKDFMAH